MQEFVKKIKEKLEERIKRFQTLDVSEVAVDVAIKETQRIAEIVNQLAEEYKVFGNSEQVNDLAIVQSLPSLYPLQPFEEEAVHRIVGSVNNNGWIPYNSEIPDNWKQQTMSRFERVE